ncbi:fimbrial protein [Xenorhabdus szentirmaii]|uniref:Fimbrial-type adhesion domain-containing protein n=2 Tax=Xenorhabdus szentirmaii TaxID=290112 RepID=W1J3E0_9GAMM|nr:MULTISPECIES: fimbrial protein [Xenorhabdus]MBD2780869.1 type 1 fimbrial protein [Xenorhabdus sp. 38]MBD2792435.1 type 1 fimbrial protein [Xenorhabdus sp. CUL]MBD2799705.1 type 1 fimbrial protein [Xenorhabdus sp. M]MBD2803272.1 type 1 fimbrial protein [Xenorhabdus sp. ZM]PHM31887.1 hypothetical protein Xsze_02611 [Xenorhabdus szentirmaii DSM 16338]
MISKLMMKKLYQLFLPVIFLGGILCSTGVEATGCDPDDPDIKMLGSSPVDHTFSMDQSDYFIYEVEVPLGVGHDSDYMKKLRSSNKISYGASKPLTAQKNDSNQVLSYMDGINMIVKSGPHYFHHTTANKLGNESNVWIRFVRGNNFHPGIFNFSDVPDLCINKDGKAVFKVRLTGTLTIKEPTCTVIDPPPVDMKSHGINEFTGKGSGTRWEDASIVLTKCQYAPSLSISISPVNGANNPKEGIMEIDSSGDAAKGIGIQLRYDLTGNSFVEFGKKHKLNKSISAGSGIKIPLSARYIQTEDSVSPGKANGRVTYTISYK